MGDRWKSVYFSRKARRQKGETPQKIGADEAGMVSSVKKACRSTCTDECRCCVSKTNEVTDVPHMPIQFNSDVDSSLYHVLASKKNDLLQACLQAFQEKRDELCQRQRLLEDEIARCEMNIQILLTEGEENWTQKIETIIEALNSSCSSRVQMNLSPEGHTPSQTTKRRKLSEAVLTSRN